MQIENVGAAIQSQTKNTKTKVNHRGHREHREKKKLPLFVLFNSQS
jgi:hypothetical protein